MTDALLSVLTGFAGQDGVYIVWTLISYIIYLLYLYIIHFANYYSELWHAKFNVAMQTEYRCVIVCFTRV